MVYVWLSHFIALAFYLLEHMNKSGFRAVLNERLSMGAVYIGSSAGSVVCSSDIEHVAPMDEPEIRAQ